MEKQLNISDFKTNLQELENRVTSTKNNVDELSLNCLMTFTQIVERLDKLEDKFNVLLDITEELKNIPE